MQIVSHLGTLEGHQTAVGLSADSGTWAQQTGRELEISWLGPMKRSLSRELYLTLAKRFSRVLGTRHKVSVFKVREKREPFGLSLRHVAGDGVVLALEVEI